jgi:hypothetical protein
MAHDMAVASIAEQLQGQQRTHRLPRRDPL